MHGFERIVSNMASALLIDHGLIDDQARGILAQLMARGVVLVPVSPPFTARTLRVALNDAGADDGWLVCREVGAVAAAATAGLTGVVLIGCAAPSDDWGIVVAEARDLGDAPRVMIPRGGGCWHDART
jgi:hypothetical protein